MTTRSGAMNIDLIHKLLKETQEAMRKYDTQILLFCAGNIGDLNETELTMFHHALTSFVTAAGFMKTLMEAKHECCTINEKEIDADILKTVKLIGVMSMLRVLDEEEKRRMN
jgi:hypothetical protein